MEGIPATVVREPGTHSPEKFAQRVRRLAAFYAVLFAVACLGIWLEIWQAQLFVALAQRSNVETLLLAFLLVFFGYVAIISAPGARSALCASSSMRLRHA